MEENAELSEAISLGKKLVEAEREKKALKAHIKDLKDCLFNELENKGVRSFVIPSLGYTIEIGEKKVINIREE
jgi:hypothetical protein